jgi:hypothetical protein
MSAALDGDGSFDWRIDMIRLGLRAIAAVEEDSDDPVESDARC